MATDERRVYTYRHPHPAVAADLAIFTIREDALELLLIERAAEPFAGRWALPGGFVRETEDLAAAAARELHEETGVEHAYLEQVGAFGAPGRDPRERVISIAYFAIVTEDLAVARAGSDARSVRWWPTDSLPELAFDHAAIVAAARQRLVDKVRRTTLALQFLAPEFTLSELQRVHELVLGEAIDKRNFRKWIAGLGYIEPTGRERRGGQFRPAALYRAKAGALAQTFDALAEAEAALAEPDARHERALEAAYRRGYAEGVQALGDRVGAAQRELLRGSG